MNPRSLLPVLFIVCSSMTPAADWKAPRAADGHPDLQGIWTNDFATPLERPRNMGDKAFYTKEEAVQVEKDIASHPRSPDGIVSDPEIWWEQGTKVVPSLRTSLIVDPPDGHLPPLTPAAQKATADQRNETRKHPDWSAQDRSLQERCIVWPGGGPVPMLVSPYNNNYQFVQTPDYVIIEIEMIHDTRIIPIDKSPSTGQHLTPAVRQWLGDSRGHWEGDTLVVETTNFTDKTRFRGSDENLRVIEKFTRTAPGILLYQFTIDDPTAFTRPWTGEIPMIPGEAMYEFACHEGNEGLAAELRNARLAEKQAANQK